MSNYRTSCSALPAHVADFLSQQRCHNFNRTPSTRTIAEIGSRNIEPFTSGTDGLVRYQAANTLELLFCTNKLTTRCSTLFRGDSLIPAQALSMHEALCECILTRGIRIGLFYIGDCAAYLHAHDRISSLFNSSHSCVRIMAAEYDLTKLPARQDG